MTLLADLLSREADMVSRFIALLNEEQAALNSGTPSQLTEIGNQKLALVEQLNQLEAQRGQCVAPSTRADDPTGMIAWLAQHPQDRQVGPLWEKLLGLAREAKALHELNGKLIAIRLKQTGDALAVLEQHKREHTFYGSDGQASQATGSRIVDSA
ncbi:MAG: flagella synthesis protein FlgN [Bacteroidota bacterium]